MASGYGLNGGPGRCFPFWQDVMACYVVNTSADDDSGKKKCSLVLEDYYECLHHKKEVSSSHRGASIRPSARPFGLLYDPHIQFGTDEKQHARALAIQAAYARSETATARDNAPSARQIRNLGLLNKEEDTKKVLGQS
ncbi:hypothetical protein BGZ63DRAFT_426777 [Mariannaea sp. PMI_226]|nr:hypothetical protein BGZ63DRAFT_426777 [Mariannaea sp. PMI_226]